VLQAGRRARILLAGQAPGRKVHASGVPFDDASGDRLRQWLGVSRETFYDPERIAILPMGFCYPAPASRATRPGRNARRPGGSAAGRTRRDRTDAGHRPVRTGLPSAG
jgi:uracil-DNA glycosylase